MNEEVIRIIAIFLVLGVQFLLGIRLLILLILIL